MGPAAGQTGPPVDKSQGWTFTKTVATDACLPGCGSSKHNPALTGLVQSIPSYFKPLFKHFLRAHKLPPAEIYHVAKVCRRQCGPALLVPMPDRTKSRWKASLIPALVKGPRFPIKTWNPLPRLSSWSRIDRLMGTTLSPTLPLTTRWSSRTSVHLRLANSPSRTSVHLRLANSQPQPTGHDKQDEDPVPGCVGCLDEPAYFLSREGSGYPTSVGQGVQLFHEIGGNPV